MATKENKKISSKNIMVHIGVFIAGAILSKYMWLLILTGAQLIVTKYIAPTSSSSVLIAPTISPSPTSEVDESKFIKTVDNKLYVFDMDSAEWFKVIAGVLTLYETYRKIKIPIKEKGSDNT